MKSSRLRKAFGLAQIMATLLVVLPTLAFLITFMFDYWAVMQADNRLKLIANMASTELDSMEDLSNLSGHDWTVLDKLCPRSTSIVYKDRDDTNASIVNVIVSYKHSGRYFDNIISTSMSTYSYHEQNATINLVCK
jgi:hypothetical protein